MTKLFEHPFLGRAFRPFFFLGSFFSLISMGIWAAYYAGYINTPDVFLDPVGWHSHEMIYGYSLAIVAGFLLTAVANWTGVSHTKGAILFLLCLLWCAGRVVMNFDIGLPVWVVQAISLSFVPALAICLSAPLLKSWSKRNFIFLVLLSILCGSQVWFFVSEGARQPLHAALMMIMVMISLIGGRIIPAFTVAAIRRRGEEAFQTPQPKTDITALISLLWVALCLVIAPDSYYLTVAASLAALIHLIRMRHYHSLRTLSDPMLWILHAGYIWLVIGLILLALQGMSVVSTSLAMHALTSGAIGSLTLGMMCRVSLGHTGRNLIATKATTVSFYCILIAGVLRVVCAAFFEEYAMQIYVAAAAFWAVGFTLFVFEYGPMLWKHRPDGKPA